MVSSKTRIKSIFYVLICYVVLYWFLTFVTGIPLYLQPLGFATVNIMCIGGMILNQIVLFFIEFETENEDEMTR